MSIIATFTAWIMSQYDRILPPAALLGATTRLRAAIESQWDEPTDAPAHITALYVKNETLSALLVKGLTIANMVGIECPPVTGAMADKAIALLSQGFEHVPAFGETWGEDFPGLFNPEVTPEECGCGQCGDEPETTNYDGPPMLSMFMVPGSKLPN